MGSVLRDAERGHAGGLRIARAELSAPAGLGAALRGFYTGRLGLPADGPLAFAEVTDGSAPFHHVAFLVPAGRFDAALAWAEARVALLPREGSPVVAFPAWRARACYFLDPAGTIAELIAHDDETAGPPGPAFSPAELLGLSEVGLVVDRPGEAAAALRRELGLALWAGSVTGPAALGFAGRRAHTLILSAAGRGWLPTGRPAEVHPVAVTLAGTGRAGEARVGPHRVEAV